MYFNLLGDFLHCCFFYEEWLYSECLKWRELIWDQLCIVWGLQRTLMLVLANCILITKAVWCHIHLTNCATWHDFYNLPACVLFKDMVYKQNKRAWCTIVKTVQPWRNPCYLTDPTRTTTHVRGNHSVFYIWNKSGKLNHNNINVCTTRGWEVDGI